MALCSLFQRIDERSSIGGYILDRGWHLASGPGNARVVEQHHLSPRRKAVRDIRIPTIHAVGEVHVEDEQQAVGAEHGSAPR